jgi:hypothetical protein
MSHIDGIGQSGSFAMNNNHMDHVEVFVVTVVVAGCCFMAAPM